MMTRDDIRHVDGDIDEISWDYEIMPLRNGDDKKILAGKDIVFLQESLARLRVRLFKSLTVECNGQIGYQRTLDHGSSYQPFTFTKYLSAAQLYTIQGELKALHKVRRTDNWSTSVITSYVKDIKLRNEWHEESEGYAPQYVSAEQVKQHLFDCYEESDMVSSQNDFTNMVPMSQQSVENLFTDLNHLRQYFFTFCHGTGLPSGVIDIDKSTHVFWKGKDANKEPTEHLYGTTTFVYFCEGYKDVVSPKDYSYYQSYFSKANWTITIVGDTTSNPSNRRLLAHYSAQNTILGEDSKMYNCVMDITEFASFHDESPTSSEPYHTTTITVNIGEGFIRKVAQSLGITLKQPTLPSQNHTYESQWFEITWWETYMTGQVDSKTRW